MITIPTLPPEGAGQGTGNPWYTHYAALDAALREAQGIIAALVAPSGLVFSVNSVAPDASGNVTLGSADVNAMAAGYAPSFSDIPIGTVVNVDKDPVTGFWPTGYNADGSAIYTGGSASHGVRPHARSSKVVWRGADPSPDSVTSGTGGMLRGVDERAIPVP